VLYYSVRAANLSYAGVRHEQFNPCWTG